jgi:hypothetical protein
MVKNRHPPFAKKMIVLHRSTQMEKICPKHRVCLSVPSGPFMGREGGGGPPWVKKSVRSKIFCQKFFVVFGPLLVFPWSFGGFLEIIVAAPGWP